MSKEATKRYAEKNCIGVYLKLNKKTDADILEILEREPNKQGYIKKLIREKEAQNVRETEHFSKNVSDHRRDHGGNKEP